MHTPTNQMARIESTKTNEVFDYAEDEPGGQVLPLIMRAPQQTPVDAPIEEPGRKGVLESRRRRAARRAGRHG